MKIYFIRHGETQINIAGGVHKLNDILGLTKKGKGQAEKIGHALMNIGIQQIYSSSDQRALETAKIIGKSLSIEPIPDSGFSERNWGDWASDRSWDDIKTYLDTLSTEERYKFIPPGGESWKEMEKRIMDSLGKIVTGKQLSTAIVTHGGVLRALLPILKGESRELSKNYDFSNASITTFNFENNKWNLVKENDTSHLAE